MEHCNNWMKRVCIGIAACMGIVVMAADPVVSNVRAFQRTGTTLFDITYDVADADTTNLSVAVAISTNNGVTWFAPASSNLTGAVGTNTVAPGNNRLIVWRGERELPAKLFSSVLAKITADDTPPSLYMVIDLSSGSNSSQYPISYLGTIPSGCWTDEYKTTKLVLRKINKGTFTMGSPLDELGRSTDETQHEVTLTKDFYIGVFEVTQQQWELVMGNRPSYFYNSSYYASRPVETVSYYDIRENPANPLNPNWPSSSQVYTNSFMGRLRTKTGLLSFDLPTESQWEFACRANTTTALNSGKNLTGTVSCTNLFEVARSYNNGGSGDIQNGDTSGGTAKVGSYLPNAWGLYDMHGNVLEWCLDWYKTYPGTVVDPRGGTSVSYRVMRGGAWHSGVVESRSSARWSYQDLAYRQFMYGFRLTMTQP